MRLVLNTCEVRSWEAGDIPSLVEQANNRKIWLQPARPLSASVHRCRRPPIPAERASQHARDDVRDRGRSARRSAASASCCSRTSSASRPRSATGSAKRTGAAASSPKRSIAVTKYAIEPARSDPRVRAAVRLRTWPRAACSRRPATCSKRGCGGAPSRTAQIIDQMQYALSSSSRNRGAAASVISRASGVKAYTARSKEKSDEAHCCRIRRPDRSCRSRSRWRAARRRARPPSRRAYFPSASAGSTGSRRRSG